MLDQGLQLCVGNVHDIVLAHRAFGGPRRHAEVADVVAVLAHSERPSINDVHTKMGREIPCKGGCTHSTGLG